MGLDRCGRVEIDYEKCDGCRLCVELCPVEVFEVVEGRVVARGVCILCLGCLAVCEKRAIRIELVECEGVEVEVEQAAHRRR